MDSAIWYHLYNLKNVKNTHGEMLPLAKLLSSMGVFHVFKIVQMVPNRAIHHIRKCSINQKCRMKRVLIT